MSTRTHFELSRRDHVATVTMTRPTTPPAFYDELRDVFDELAADEELRAVVLRGCGKCFSYGLDLPATMSTHGKLFVGGGLAHPRGQLRQLIKDWQGAVDLIASLPVPVIAAVHGWCIGAGLDLAAACDIRLCSADARFSLREARVAIVADLGSLQRLPPIIGRGHLRELAYTAGDIDAARAERIGLVNDVYEDRAALDEAAAGLADRIAANPPLTIRGVKHVLDACADKSIGDGLDYVATWNAAFLASEDLGEAASAFMARREPTFKGR